MTKARKKAKLSQRELSIRLGMPTSYIGKCELGERRIDLIEFMDIAEILEIDEIEIIQNLKKIKKEQ